MIRRTDGAIKCLALVCLPQGICGQFPKLANSVIVSLKTMVLLMDNSTKCVSILQAHLKYFSKAHILADFVKGNYSQTAKCNT